MVTLGGTPGVILPDCEEVLEMTIEEDWAEVVIASDGVWDAFPTGEMPQVTNGIYIPSSFSVCDTLFCVIASDGLWDAVPTGEMPQIAVCGYFHFDLCTLFCVVSGDGVLDARGTTREMPQVTNDIYLPFFCSVYPVLCHCR